MSALQNLFNKLPQPLANHFAQSKRRASVKSALIVVANRHPDWVDVAFDEHFVAHQGAASLANYFESGQLPDAASLAAAWSNQFNWQSTTKMGAQERFMPVAEDFVYLLGSAPNHAETTLVPRRQVDPVRYGATQLQPYKGASVSYSQVSA